MIDIQQVRAQQDHVPGARPGRFLPPRRGPRPVQGGAAQRPARRQDYGRHAAGTGGWRWRRSTACGSSPSTASRSSISPRSRTGWPVSWKICWTRRRRYDCPAIVLCPNNDTKDTRDPETRLSETVAALTAFGPSFTRRGILGYVEPLGFAECSLPSIVTAVTAITRSGHSCYRVVYDTFHHYLGPDTEKEIGTSYDVSHTGLIHVSGVESSDCKGKVPGRAQGAGRPRGPHVRPGADCPPHEAGLHGGHFLRAFLPGGPEAAAGGADGGPAGEHGVSARVQG